MKSNDMEKYLLELLACDDQLDNDTLDEISIFIEDINSDKVLTEDYVSTGLRFIRKLTWKTLKHFAKIVILFYGARMGIKIVKATFGLTYVTIRETDKHISDVPSWVLSKAGRKNIKKMVSALCDSYVNTKFLDFLYFIKKMDTQLEKKMDKIYKDLEKQKNKSGDVKVALAGIEHMKRKLISMAQRHITGNIVNKMKFKVLQKNAMTIKKLNTKYLDKPTKKLAGQLIKLITDSQDIIKYNKEIVKTIDADMSVIYDSIDEFEKKYKDQIFDQMEVEGGDVYHTYAKGLNIIKKELKNGLKVAEQTSKAYNDVSEMTFRRLYKIHKSIFKKKE